MYVSFENNKQADPPAGLTREQQKLTCETTLHSLGQSTVRWD